MAFLFHDSDSYDERQLLSIDENVPSHSHAGSDPSIVKDPLYRIEFEDEITLMTKEELVEYKRRKYDSRRDIIRTQIFVNSMYKQTAFIDKCIVNTGKPKLELLSAAASAQGQISRVTPSLLRVKSGGGVKNFFPFPKQKVLKIIPSPLTNKQLKYANTTNELLAHERLDTLVERLRKLIKEMTDHSSGTESNLKLINKIARDAGARDDMLYQAMYETQHATKTMSFVSNITRDINVNTPLFFFAPVPRKEYQLFKCSKFGREFYDVSYMTVNQVEALINLKANLITRNHVQYEYFSGEHIPYKFVWISKQWLKKSMLTSRIQIWYNPLGLTLIEVFDLLYVDKTVQRRVERSLFSLYDTTSLMTSISLDLEMP